MGFDGWESVAVSVFLFCVLQIGIDSALDIRKPLWISLVQLGLYKHLLAVEIHLCLVEHLVNVSQHRGVQQLAILVVLQ